jgi:hypothetical protein
MVGFGSWRGLTCKSQISPVMKNALSGVMYSVFDYGIVRGLCPILPVLYEPLNPAKAAHGRCLSA